MNECKENDAARRDQLIEKHMDNAWCERIYSAAKEVYILIQEQRKKRIFCSKMRGELISEYSLAVGENASE